jgi:O-antigen ligase
MGFYMRTLIKKVINAYWLHDVFSKTPPLSEGTRSERMDMFIVSLMPLLLYVFFFCMPILKGLAGPAYVSYCLCYGVHLYLRPEKKYLEKPRLYYVLLLIYLSTGALSLTYTPDFINGLKTLKTHCGLVFIPLLIETVSSRDRARHYLIAYALGGGILALMGIYQGLVMHIDRPPTLWHATHGSHLLAFAAAVVLALVLSERNTTYRFMQLLLLFILSFALYINGSRGSWLAFGTVLFVVPFVIRDVKMSFKVGYSVALLVVIFLICYSPYGSKKINDAINDAQSYNQISTPTADLELAQLGTSLGPRFAMWNASMAIFLKNPIIGTGIGGWGKEIAVMMKRKEAPQFLNRFGETHNMYFDVLSTRGIVGLSTFLAVVGYPLWYGWRKRGGGYEPFRYLVIFVGVIFMVAGLTETVTEIRWSFLSYIGLTGVALAILTRQDCSQQALLAAGHSSGGDAR